MNPRTSAGQHESPSLIQAPHDIWRAAASYPPFHLDRLDRPGHQPVSGGRESMLRELTSRETEPLR